MKVMIGTLGLSGWCVVALVAAACSRSNNLLLGRVEANVGSHWVVVTDCYRTSVPPPRRETAPAGQPVYRFTPCRDADVLIRGAELFVNGKSYGRLAADDGIVVDHSVVSIHQRQTRTGGKGG
ncbi:MAG TPA: hypothetical protein VHR45_08135 [Thermoanaerobaculia bacterium]|nr:hypothetical protein [Thermoanaerobaculia bacterium]